MRKALARAFKTVDEKKQERESYEIWSLGANNYGQQLNGSTIHVKTLQKIQDLKRKKAKQIYTMRWGATFVVHDDGDMSVGGCNHRGQLGVGSIDKAIKRIHHLDLKVNIISKGIGSKHVIIQTKDGKLHAVGSNWYNQCGVETKAKKHNNWIDGPQMKIDIKSIATTVSSTIFLCTKGAMYACGKSEEGALGMGSKTKEVSTPTAISTNTMMIQVAVGDDHCVAISNDQNTAFSWGLNRYGQCGHGQNNRNIWEPTRIESLRNKSIKQVDCGSTHTLLVGSYGVLFVTGSNGNGRCGDGTTNDVFKPKAIRVGDNALAQSVKCGADHNVLITTKNQIFVWGYNGYNQCLIPGGESVLIPTLWTIPNMFKHRKIQVIPGYRETRIIATAEIAEFLWSLGLEEYVDAFVHHKFEAMDQLQDITDEYLKEIGVAIAHRVPIKRAITSHFKKAKEANKAMVRNDKADVEEQMMDDEDDTKTEDDAIVVQNLLTICVAIGEYANKENLHDVCRDVANYRDVLLKKYNYKFMTSVDMKGNHGYTMTKQDVEDFINNECLLELIGGTRIKPKAKYDGLLVAFSGHGTLGSIVCSDGKKIAYSTIREWFQTNKVLLQIPRFYCIDACRQKESKKVKKEMDEMKHSDDEEESAFASRGWKGEAPAATIMGQTEGHIVRGGKVSKYLCKQWDTQFKANEFNEKPFYKPFGALYDAAYREVLDKTSQRLTVSEYDRFIDKVVFVPKERGRGIGHVDGTAPVIDHDLQTILGPQSDSKFNLMQHFFVLFNANYRNNKALCRLSDDTLAELGIEEVFHRKELMNRVRKLTKK